MKQRPAKDAPEAAWVHYTYTKANETGVQKEWWYHRSGCRQWMQAVRNTITNEVLETLFPER